MPTTTKDPITKSTLEIVHLEQAYSATMEYLRNHYKEMSFEKVLFFAKQIVNLEMMKDAWYHHITKPPAKENDDGKS